MSYWFLYADTRRKVRGLRKALRQAKRRLRAAESLHHSAWMVFGPLNVPQHYRDEFDIHARVVREISEELRSAKRGY